MSPLQQQRKAQRNQENSKRLAAKARPSASKALLLLKAKYDSTLLTLKDGLKIDLQRTKPKDLYVDLAQLLQIFEALMEVKKVTRKPIDDKILLTLLGLSPEQLKDPYLVTKDVLKLLERDQDTTRALYLCLKAKKNAQVGMNAVLQWTLDHGNVEEAIKCLNHRKKWGIPANNHTYVHFFSGVAKCHEWGLVPDDLAEKCVEMFEKLDVEPTIEIFNAVLSVLVKNFSGNQQKAWEFFENLEGFQPTSQTFTIFLNGCKKYHQHLCQEIRQNMSINSSQRAAKLYKAQAELVGTANMVYAKLKKAAVPPVPPTKEQADLDPILLENYRKKTKKPLMDIDEVFASTFVLCFINNHAGTSYSASQGSHYAYLQQGLTYLQLWCPEIEGMMYYVQKAVNGEKIHGENHENEVATKSKEKTSNSDHSVYFSSSVSSEIQKRTDSRMELANLDPKISPLANCRPLTREEVNPQVVFPPPAFSTKKTKAIFSGRQKRLVDFGRPTFSDIEKLVEHKKYVHSRGRHGKKLLQPNQISMERKPGINKFLLQLALDALIKLGLHREFYLAMWYALTKWGGLYVSRTQLIEAERVKLALGALPDSEYPVLKKIGSKLTELQSESSETSETVSLAQRIRLTQGHDSSIVDYLLVENFIYKMEENFHHSDAPVRFAAELIAAMVSESCNMLKLLVPREKTFDYIFSILNRDVHLYNDKNLHVGAVSSRRRSLANNTPKKSLKAQQLTDILEPLLVLMQSIMVFEQRQYAHVKNRKLLMLNKFVESYNSLISTLYRTTWTDAPENHPNALKLHKKIVRLGILLYKPKALVDPRDKLVFAEPILDSLQFVYKTLKVDPKLEKNEKKLMVAIRLLFQLDVKKPEALEILESIRWKIFQHSK